VGISYDLEGLLKKRTVVTMQKIDLGLESSLKTEGGFMRQLLVILMVSLLSSAAFAQSVDVTDGDGSATTGKAKANQYFKSRKEERSAPAATESTGGAGGATPHYLALEIGGFIQGQEYKWGEGGGRNAGRFNGGVTYRMGEWVNSTDLGIRLEYSTFSLGDAEGDARALSFTPMLTFPDANSRFPLYFGGGVGLDMFIQQVHDRSSVALTWQVVAGARFMDVFPNIGFLVETGLKNHVLLLSEGQYNGVFLNGGVVFAF
jgi:hypothetical protein